MAQGKLKVKGKVPKTTKVKKQKGSAATRRSNRPVPAKKQEVAQKLKQAITKTVNKSAEQEMRARAAGGPKNLSKAQQAVATHHSKAKSSST